MTISLIGVTLDWSEKGGYSEYPWYAVRENYCQAIEEAGGTPIMLPHHIDQIPHYLDVLDGLVITGGDFDVNPEYYGETTVHPRVSIKHKRCEFEYKLAQKAFELDLPMLGICGGQQLLNVALGGKLIQHVLDEVPKALDHEQKTPRNQAYHSVRVAESTLLHRIIGGQEIQVNSAHHQAVHSVANGVVINAYAPDGVIEGIEHPDKRFCLGVQWHPEFIIGEHDRSIFHAFVAATRG